MYCVSDYSLQQCTNTCMYLIDDDTTEMRRVCETKSEYKQMENMYM